MKHIQLLTLILLWSTLTACITQQTKSVIQPVWTQDAQVPQDLATPAGFSISPHEAHRIVFNARRLSLKHQWHLYADDSNYYIQDAFTGSSATKGGVVVNGETGQIMN